MLRHDELTALPRPRTRDPRAHVAPRRRRRIGHGERLSARRFRTSLREESYLRAHWPLLRELRDALRTEPNVRLAVLFGSLATDIGGRLSRRLGREVQLVRLADAERSAVLMATALERGRVLVDRDGRWSQLKAAEGRWQRRARHGAFWGRSREQPLPVEARTARTVAYGWRRASVGPH